MADKKTTKKKAAWTTYIPSLVGIVALLILGRCVNHGFLSMNNISSILMTSSILTLASMGQALVIISGDSGLDMSISAVMSMTALFCPMVNIGGNGVVSMVFAVLAALAIGAIVGFLNGIGVKILKIVPLVMTLIMSFVVEGFTIFITKGQPSVMVSDTLKSVSKVLVGPFRVLTVLCIVVLVLMEIYFLRRSKYGNSLFLVGNNTNAATLCGLNSRKIVILAYAFGGALAGFAGLMLVGYAGTAQMGMAGDYTMLSIAAVVIGGTKLTGGKGTFVGGALGSILLILITTILQVLNMPAGLRSLLNGIVLLGILIANNRAPKLRQ